MKRVFTMCSEDVTETLYSGSHSAYRLCVFGDEMRSIVVTLCGHLFGTAFKAAGLPFRQANGSGAERRGHGADGFRSGDDRLSEIAGN